MIYDTYSFQNLICLPKVSKYYKDIAPSLDVDGISKLIGDLSNTKFFIISSGVLSIIIIGVYI